MFDLPETSKLFLDGNRGIYIPRDFAECIKREHVENVSAEQWAILDAGPDHEFYWDAWTEVLDGAVLTDPVTAVRYTLWQDGDLWIIPEGAEWPDE